MMSLLPAAAFDRAVGYTALFLVGWSPLLWSLGYSQLSSLELSSGEQSAHPDSLAMKALQASLLLPTPGAGATAHWMVIIVQSKMSPACVPSTSSVLSREGSSSDTLLQLQNAEGVPANRFATNADATDVDDEMSAARIALATGAGLKQSTSASRRAVEGTEAGRRVFRGLRRAFMRVRSPALPRPQPYMRDASQAGCQRATCGG